MVRLASLMTTVYTAGHGNRPLEEFIGLLRDAGVTCLVDVRAFPASRRHPHFGRAALEQSLPAEGIRYVWEGEALGGRRKPSDRPVPRPPAAARDGSRAGAQAQRRRPEALERPEVATIGGA